MRTRNAFTLQENIAAISATVHCDGRLSDYIERTEESFTERLAWCVEAGKVLTAKEPRSYEAAGLDWYDVIDDVAEGFFADLDCEDAVSQALNPKPVDTTPSLPDAATALVDNCEGRLPADSSDSVAIESVLVLRLKAALSKPKGR